LWKGGGWDILKGNVLSRIVSKVLIDKGVLGEHREEVLFLVFSIGKLVGSNMGKNFKIIGRSRGDGGAGDNIGGGVWNIEEWEVLDVIESGPDKLW